MMCECGEPGCSNCKQGSTARKDALRKLIAEMFQLMGQKPPTDQAAPQMASNEEPETEMMESVEDILPVAKKPKRAPVRMVMASLSKSEAKPMPKALKAMMKA